MFRGESQIKRILIFPASSFLWCPQEEQNDWCWWLEFTSFFSVYHMRKFCTRITHSYINTHIYIYIYIYICISWIGPLVKRHVCLLLTQKSSSPVSVMGIEYLWRLVFWCLRLVPVPFAWYGCQAFKPHWDCFTIQLTWRLLECLCSLVNLFGLRNWLNWILSHRSDIKK